MKPFQVRSSVVSSVGPSVRRVRSLSSNSGLLSHRIIRYCMYMSEHNVRKDDCVTDGRLQTDKVTIAEVSSRLQIL